MKTLLTLILNLLVTAVIAQSETFDLTSYTLPSKGEWKKEVKENVVSYTKTDNVKRTWCQIGIYRSTASKGSIEADFDSEWQLLIATPYNIQAEPKSGGIQEAEGWKIKVGSGTFSFNNSNAQAILAVMSGNDRVVSIVAINNSQDYMSQIKSLLESVKLTIPETKSELLPISDSETSAITGSWGKSNSVGQINNRFGNYSYNKQQYYFNSNGTYTFLGKNYSEQYNETLLIKESGKYSVNGNNLTINPENSVIEAWSKKNGGDNWNMLKTSQQRPLEKFTYKFAIEEKNLVLQADRETQRDGRFSNGNTYSYGPPGTFTPIKLPGE
ncbi:MAG TPA: hypothetical protein VK205_11270 [Prolixibacteraceae bacterium]|nr:hypothetical protein [Prolixibacteraceae bacterium]